ncbi:uncharacterized protein LOC143851424 [Tasmannia lanceolata]|uniref:uncharacterized protein LOC143851424 n=1 Tax=Tasmannia lanceolata TaxID=3420 RepID=UPI00406336AF
MEAVGARLGRSSTRYGPAIVFSGPVRKWKKKWVPISPSSSSNPPPSSSTTNGNNTSHLLLYKWAPLSQTNNTNNSGKDDAATVPDEPPRRKFRYVPVSVIEEQNEEAATNVDDDDTKPSDSVINDPSPMATKSDDSGGKPDVNDVPMEETQASSKGQSAPQDLNETSLDLSLGLKARNEGNDPRMSDQSEGGQLERLSSGGDIEMKPATNSEGENRTKRKSMVPDLEMRV